MHIFIDRAYARLAPKILTRFNLKCLALICMFVDHWALLFLPIPEQTGWRILGRLAFPIICFFLIEGFLYTRNVKEYLWRLFLFALLSEPIYDWFFYQTWFYPAEQNVLFTLFIGLFTLAFWKQSALLAKTILHLLPGETRLASRTSLLVSGCLKILAILWAVVLIYLLKPDYQFLGLAMILVFYFWRGRFILLSLSLGALNALGAGYPQSYAVLALLPLALYNGQKGLNIKYGFYLFYPLHLLSLGLFRQFWS